VKRLVYSPSVKIWVKTDFGVVDLSPHITECRVQRKVNDLSSLDVVFRNPKVLQDGKPRFLFTQRVQKDGNIGPVFHPMDPITVIFERIAGKPIQVFTGYCDTVPYVQLFPGTARLTASCTLKRLNYTYFDPGLPFVMDFMSQYGWQLGGNGVVKKGGAGNSGTASVITDSQISKAVKSTNVNDSSIGYLLYAVLNEIGGWNNDNIYIQSLPNNISQIVGKLFDEFAKDNKNVNEEIAKFVREIIGNGDYGKLLSNSTDSNGVTGTGVTMVGDSITNMSRTELEAAMPGITIYAENSKHMAWGPDGYGSSTMGGDSGLKILKNNKLSLGGIVIVALGTNDEDNSKATFLRSIDKAMANIGSNRKAVFVTVTTNNHVNEAIREAHSKHSNLSIADWASKAEIDPNNQPHPTTHGKLVFAKTIADVVNTLRPVATASNPGSEPEHISLPIPQNGDGLNYWESNNNPKIIVLHVTQTDNIAGTADLRNLKDGLMRRSDWATAHGIPNRGISVHVGVDNEGNSARFVNDQNQAHHCGYRSKDSLGIEHIGYASQSVSAFTDAQINKSAQWVAYWSTKFNIPLVRSTTNGICGHGELGSRGGDHPDCPGNLPINKIINKAKAIQGGQ